MASLLQEGSTSPAPFPSAGQMAPKILAELVLCSCGAEGRVPRFAHRRVTLFFCPIRASSLHEGSFVNSYYCLIDGSPCRSLSRRLGGRGRLLNSERCITLHTVRVCDPATEEDGHIAPDSRRQSIDDCGSNRDLSTLRNDAIGGVAPNCDQQLTRHGDDSDAAGAPLQISDTLAKPTCQVAVWLITQPEPGELDERLARPSHCRPGLSGDRDPFRRSGKVLG